MGETATFAATLQERRRKNRSCCSAIWMFVDVTRRTDARSVRAGRGEWLYFHGRGSEDNKFDVAMMVATMALKKDGFKPADHPAAVG